MTENTNAPVLLKRGRICDALNFMDEGLQDTGPEVPEYHVCESVTRPRAYGCTADIALLADVPICGDGLEVPHY